MENPMKMAKSMVYILENLIEKWMTMGYTHDLGTPPMGDSHDIWPRDNSWKARERMGAGTSNKFLPVGSGAIRGDILGIKNRFF